MRFALDFLGVDEFHQGDVFVANDPYHGGGHLPDYNVFAPVVVDDHLVLISSIQCHHGDTGGAVPGGYNVTATDIWGEGVRWPVVKVLDRGVERRDVLYALQVNNRLDGYLGDLRAQIGAAKQAADDLVGLVERYGVDMIEAAVDHMIDYAAARFAEEISAWPDGSYEGDAYVDHDPLGNPDIHLHVKITVDGPKLTIDYTGSRRAPGAAGLVDLRQHAGLHGGPDRRHDGPRDPQERGLLQLHRADRARRAACSTRTRGGRCRPGRTTPGPTSARSSPWPCRACCPSGPCPRPTRPASRRPSAASTRAAAQVFVDGSAEVYAGWCNAAKGMDAWGAVSASFGNLWKATAEINESLYPHIQWSRDYRTDSGGPGQWRGGCGSHYIKEVRVPAAVYTYVVGHEVPHARHRRRRPRGAQQADACATAPTDAFVVKHTADWEPMEAGDRINFDYGGGGGWGDPLDRPAAAVLDDVLDEYVSVEGAAATTASC